MFRALVVAISILAVTVSTRVMFAQQALTYWCPMHPDERAPSAIACPICKMTMVQIPPMRVGEYRLDVAPIRAAQGRGLDGVRVTLREPSTGAAAQALETVHERPLHLFIVSSDFVFFRHVHAESVTDGVAEVRVGIPPGEYMLIADFVPTSGVPQLVHRSLIAPGARPAPGKRAALWVDGGVRARPISNGLQAGSEGTVRFALTATDDGRPILDLEPYLGAPAHLLLVNENLTEAVHAHAAEWTGAEPVLSFTFTLPAHGTYQGWLQLQRAGRVVSVPVSFLGK